MRFKTLAAILFLFLSTALTASANSVQGKSKSNYGDSPYLTDVGSSETSGGTTLQLVCPVSLGCPILLGRGRVSRSDVPSHRLHARRAV